MAAIAYIDGFRLHRALNAGVQRVLSCQDHLNRINVFPVPDGDTGTNLSLTLTALLAGISDRMDRHIGNMLNALADAALDGARGNSGAILAQFFQGMSDGASALRMMTTERFVKAVRMGADYAHEALAEPKEGTLLTVLRDFAGSLDTQFTQAANGDYVEILKRGLEDAQRSLENTTNQLEALRKAGVVDAGAAGFVELLRGIVAFIESGSIRDMAGYRPDVELAAEAEEIHGGDTDLTHRFCTECVINGTDIERRKLREELSEIGSSLVIAGTKNKVKVHVHVNSPGQVFLIAERYGTISSQKADDMQAQTTTAGSGRDAVAIITDSAADIPDSEAERLNIHMVPLRLHFGERSYLDKVSITPGEFYSELERSPLAAKTSQPAPGDFRRQFQFLASHHDSVLSINLMRKVSGTLQAAESAATRVEGTGVRVLDCLNVAAGQGLVVMHAAELAQAGATLDEIVAGVQDVIPHTYTWGAIADLQYAVRGGRVSRGKKLLTDLLHLRPILTNTKDGRVAVGGVLFGRRDMVGKFARFVTGKLDPRKPWRLVVGHCNAPENGARLRELLIDEVPQVEASWLIDVGPALGVHAGPGALVVGAQRR